MPLDLTQYGNQTVAENKPQTKKGAANYISEGLGLAGGIVGSLAGPIGSIAGAGIGSGLGQKLENKVTGKNTNAVIEGLYGAGGQALGLGVGKVLSSLASKGASKLSTSLIAKAYKPSASVIKKSAFNSVDDFAKYVAKNNNKLSDEAIAALQGQYDDLAMKSGAKVNVNKLFDSLTKEAARIAKEGGTKKVNFSKQILDEANLLKSQLKGKTADISDITAIRRSFDESVKNFGKDDLTDINLWMRNRLKNTIDTAANSAAKKVDGRAISDISKELNKNYSAREIIENAIDRGATRGPITMSGLGLGVAGASGAAGGIPGAALGIIAGNAISNPGVVGGAAGMLAKVGANAGKFGKVAQNVAGGLGQINTNAVRSMAEPMQDQTAMDMAQSSQPMQTQATPEVMQEDQNQQYIQQALLNDMQTTGGKNIDKILKVAQFMGVDTTGKAKTVKAPTAMQAQVGGYANRLASANQTFDQIESQVAGTLTNKLSVARNIPERFKSESLKLQDQAERNFINAVLRRESGAAIAPSEFESARKQYFPQPGDSKAVLAQKRQNRLLVQQNFVNESSGQQVAGQDVVTQLLQQIGQ
jgi:hypothetical protein